DVLAVGRDRRQLDAPPLVLDPVRLDDAAGTVLDGVAVRVIRVGYRHRHVLDAVAVCAREARDLAVRPQAGGEDEADGLLLEDVRRAVTHARLGAGVCGAREAEGVLVEVGGLLRVPDVELEVVPAVDREVVDLPHPASKISLPAAQTRSTGAAPA